MKKKIFKKLLFLGGIVIFLLSGISYYLYIYFLEYIMNII